ncbi:MAG: putative ABC transporter permease [Lachnospiraceae bacterium]|nr:putative ABC transporter permease [Lachnospiraceae bacterium]
MKNQYSHMTIIIMFLIISHIAWIWEGIITVYEAGEFVNRGFLHGFWLPIYGSGSIILIKILGQTKHSVSMVFICSMLICGIIEYVTSFVLEKLFNKKWWDYNYLSFHLNGRISLFSVVMFGIAGCLLIFYIAPFLNKQINKIPIKLQKFICILFCGCFCTDVLVSLLNPNVGMGITF